MSLALSNGWTGGQYSLFRIIFGAYLVVHFVQLAPWGPELFSNEGALPEASASPLLYFFPNILAVWDDPAFVVGMLLTAAGLAVLLAVGWHDRIAAVLLWYVWACLHGRMPLISNPGLPYVGFLLLAHACLPPAPYGSWAARGRIDPGGGWHFPGPIFLVAWILMAAGYSYSGYTKLISPSWVDGTALERVLNNPLARPNALRDWLLAMPAWFLRWATWGALALELAFTPLALVRVLRPWIWGVMLLMHFNLMAVIDFADLSLGMIMLHLFTFDPGWVKPAPVPLLASGQWHTERAERIFYDGQCGLCHRTVRFVLAEDRLGAFRFAPLESEAFRAGVPEAERAALPDSFVVQAADGRLLVRSAAILHILRRLGGVWRILAGLLLLVPRPVRDSMYNGVARVRRRLFRTPAEACPVLPKQLRERFDY